MEYVITTLQDDIPVRDLITLYYFEVNPNFSFAGESHDFWELNYVDAGELTCCVNGKQLVLHQGDIVFYPPNDFHTHHCNGIDPTNLMVLTFVCKSQLLEALGNQVLHLNDRQILLLSNIITEAQNAFSSPLNTFVSCEMIRRAEKSFAAEQLIRLNLEMLLIELLRSQAISSLNAVHTAIKSASDNEKVNHMLAFLQDNIYRRITIRDVCAHIALSPTNVKALFKRVTGQPIMTYYTDLKITEAKRLLRKGVYSIGEISELLAYTSIQYFSKQFKKETGMSPTEYASSVKAKSNLA